MCKDIRHVLDVLISFKFRYHLDQNRLNISTLLDFLVNKKRRGTKNVAQTSEMSSVKRVEKNTEQIRFCSDFVLYPLALKGFPNSTDWQLCQHVFFFQFCQLENNCQTSDNI